METYCRIVKTQTNRLFRTFFSACLWHKGIFITLQLTYIYSGLNCTEDDPCLPNPQCPPGRLCYGPCDPNIVCIGATGQPHCRGCVAGYTGIKCEDDVDECTGEQIKWQWSYHFGMREQWRFGSACACSQEISPDHMATVEQATKTLVWLYIGWS